jgi:hypothetical protein
MAIATATAIAIGATAASTAGSVYAAKKGASAAKNAADVQGRSADRALDLQRNIYNQQMQMQSPWVGLGQQSAMTLGRLTGVTPGSRFAAPPMQAPMGMGPIGMGMGGGMGGMGGGVPRAPIGPQQMAPRMPMQQMPMPQQSQMTLGGLMPFSRRIEEY